MALRPGAWRTSSWLRALAALLTLALIGCGGDDEVEPLTIAYLSDSSGDLGEFGPQIQQGVDLAIEHLNAAGGVFGEPVELIVADTGSDPAAAVEVATGLVEEDGVDVIVGPLGTAAALAVAEQVSRDLEIPTITPSATSPALSTVDDGGFFLRTTLSDAAQGPILAQLVIADLEVDNVAVLFEDSAYGHGLFDAFAQVYSGQVTSVAYLPGQVSYLAELREAAAGGASYLVAIGYPAEAEVYLVEATSEELFEGFVFVDGTRSLDLIAALGPGVIDGSKGTAPATSPVTVSTRAFDDAFRQRFGALPTTPFVREAYDAAIVLALAAEAAGSPDGPRIAGSLFDVANPVGVAVTPGVASLRSGLEAAREGTDIDYRGAASSVDWDERGDLATGYIGVWAYEDGAVVDLETIPFDFR